MTASTAGPTPPASRQRKGTSTNATADGPAGPVVKGALVGVILVALNMRSSTAGVGSVLPDVTADLHWSEALASGLVVLPLLCFAALSPLAPAISRKLGMHRTVMAALAVLTVGILLRSVPGSVWIWAGTVLLGAGIAVLNVVTPVLVKRDFPHRAAVVTAAYSAVQGGTAAVATVAVAFIIGIDGGLWRAALASSVVFALAGLAYWLFLALRTSTREDHLAQPAPSNHPAPSPWRKRLAWQIAAFMSMQSTVFYVMITWLPSIEQQHGIPAVQAGLHQSLLQAATLVATVLGALLLRRGPDQRAIVVVATCVMTTGIVGLLVHPALAGLWACCVGAGGGLTLVTALSLFAMRTRTMAETGAVSAMGQSIGYLVAAAGPVLLGSLHDATGDWTGVLLILLGLLALQTLAGLRAAKPGHIWN
ncbi:MFS transporter [[Kitasatospora] papulosa]|uniref:MFS transporter n=1 Tax=[Kitasatospora] papulosa TaxID=1464011 RepID=UPI00369DF9C8